MHVLAKRTDQESLDLDNREPLLRDFKRSTVIHNRFYNNSTAADEIYLTDLSREMTDRSEQRDSLDDDEPFEHLGMDSKGNMKFQRTISMHDDDTFDLDKEIERNLLGIFVVAFDTRLGNVIEWQLPESLNLEQIEFKAMASGFHLVQKDFVYFCKDDMYGLAAFESLKVDSSEERNVRMKSVGLVAKSYRFLKRFVTYLRNQVRFQLENPDGYENLRSLWETKTIKNISEFLEDHQTRKERLIHAPMTNTSVIDKLFNKRATIFKQVSAINLIDFYNCTKFALYFGPSLFCLWKYVLLNKRVMFYSLPPVNDLCARVLCSSLMLSTSFSFVSGKQMLKPFFYVSVSDINDLQQQPFYLACTSEKIFENKEFLYDLYVNDSHMNAVLVDSQRNLLKINSADKKRYDLLLKKIIELTQRHSNIFSKINSFDEDETVFTDFFIEQNDKIFSVLEDLEYEEPKTTKTTLDNREGFNLQSLPSKAKQIKRNEPNYVTASHIKKMGLDPSDDRDFLNELIRFYDFNLILVH